MRLLIPKWYSPFNNGWKLCSYETKSQGYDDLSHRLLEFKENDTGAINAFTAWSIAKLQHVLPAEIDYCIRSLGRDELKPSNTRPLHYLAKSISDHFGIEYIPDLIAKKKTTQHLVSLKKPQRESELAGVFKLSKKIDLAGASILLIDDIRTTGTTTRFIYETIAEQFEDVNCYLFVLAQTNDGGNTKEVIDMYAKFC